MTTNNNHVLPMKPSVWHLAVSITVPEKGVDPGVPGPTDEACLEVTKHSFFISHGLDTQPAVCPPL